jgi:hypothetical protein
MKKIWLGVIIMAVMFVSSVFAKDIEQPIAKGKMLIDGSLSFSSFSGDYYDNDDVSLLSADISFNYFVYKGLALGILGSYYKTEDNDDNSKYKYTITGIGPQVMYFFDLSNLNMKSTEESEDEEATESASAAVRFYPYIGLAYLSESSKSESSYYSSYYHTWSSSTNEAGLKTLTYLLGAMYMLNDNVGISADYSINNQEYDPKPGDIEKGKENRFKIGLKIFI